MPPFEQTLGLVFNNFTNWDIAIDGSCNYPKKLIQLIRNKEYTPIVNGTKITDSKQLIEDILYIGVGNLERIKEYSVLVAQKNKKSASTLTTRNERLRAKATSNIY